MENVLLVVSLISCLGLIGAVLLQRSEGGALGMGGGGGGGLVSGRGAATSLVRVTMVLAAVFFVSCLLLTRINAGNSEDSSSVVGVIEDSEVATPSETPIAEVNDSAVSASEEAIADIDDATGTISDAADVAGDVAEEVESSAEATDNADDSNSN